MPKILLVDDSSFIRSHYSKLLTEHGYDVSLAQDGTQAVECYRLERPDLVLMDIVMPHMSGLDALNAIRRLDPQARVIILTAMDQKAVTGQALAMGAQDLIIKPILPSQLLAKIEKLLRRVEVPPCPRS
ncbi:MAG: response regulator [Thermoflexales bacterium]|nr:response regulator [Thermoflexales bacterium]